MSDLFVSMEQKMDMIIDKLLLQTSDSVSLIFYSIVDLDFVSLHGPEHHMIDGGSVLTAFRNAGGEIDLKESLLKLKKEALRMPGAMCGLWGVCGAVTSVGAALAILDKTGPLSSDGSWGKHMEYTSEVVKELGRINGPRCCKRDGLIALKNAVAYINQNYNVELKFEDSSCKFKDLNQQCIKEKCPFYNL